MENYHIRKINLDQVNVNEELSKMKEEASRYNGSDVMNSRISLSEVDLTFNCSTGAPGPDKFLAMLVDNADREVTTMCLSGIWNKAWDEGMYLKCWKEEIRPILPKPEKSTYHECNSYRTVSITALIGKRFEKITSRRLKAWLEENSFDVNQFAYMQKRSTTQALLILVERLKQAVIKGEYASAIFYDFVDAFGTVDRLKLLKKVQEVGVKGKLLLHLMDFLKDRKARIHLGEEVGEWIDSIHGTLLGPILFIIFLYDIPEAIKPKFADDITEIVISKDELIVKEGIQESANKLGEWADKWGMEINAGKTKVMVFGSKLKLDTKMKGVNIEQVEEHRVLGMVFDTKMNLDKHVYTCGKARPALNKIGILIRGRKGLSIEVAINLYKTLVRPHLEYAFPAWSCISANQLKLIERVQKDGLRILMGVFKNSSCQALEVISNVMPISLRTKELCCREWTRIKALDILHPCRKMLEEKERGGMATPMETINQISRSLKKELVKRNASVRKYPSLNTAMICKQRTIEQFVIYSSNIGNSTHRSGDQKDKAVEEFKVFMEKIGNEIPLVFTDGSVYGENSVGNGGSGAVLVIGGVKREVKSEYVGRLVDNVDCEVASINLGLKLLRNYFANEEAREVGNKQALILNDCRSAIQIICKQRNTDEREEVFNSIWKELDNLDTLNVKIKVGWIPGHAGVEFNEEAAKKGARSTIMEGEDEMSCKHLKKVIHDLSTKEWEKSWGRNESGGNIKLFGECVGNKVYLPKDRSTGMSYVRCLLNNAAVKDTMFKYKLSDSATCECNKSRETVEHVILECELHQNERQSMINEMERIWNSTRSIGSLQFNLRTVLYPQSIKKLSRRVALELLEATFRFLHSIKKL